MRQVGAADLLIVAGTSLEVSPVNQLPVIAKNNPGVKTVFVNSEGTAQNDLFDLVISAEIGSVLTRVKECLLTYKL